MNECADAVREKSRTIQFQYDIGFVNFPVYSMRQTNSMRTTIDTLVYFNEGKR